MNDEFPPFDFILVDEIPKFSDKRSEVIYYLDALLIISIFLKMGNVLALGIYDLDHDLRVIPEIPHNFDFWDNDMFTKIEEIIANSPSNSVEMIHFQYNDGACVILPVKIRTYLILLCKGKSGIERHPLEKWRKQIMYFVQQLGSEEE